MNTRLEDEITEQEWFYHYTKPIVLIVVVIMALLSESFGPIITYISVFIFVKLAFFILNCIHSLKSVTNEKSQEKRTKCIIAEIKQIKVIADVEYDEVQILCEANVNGVKKIFKSKMFKGIAHYKVGDKINVMMDPDNYNNYLVLLDDELV